MRDFDPAARAWVKTSGLSPAKIWEGSRTLPESRACRQHDCRKSSNAGFQAPGLPVKMGWPSSLYGGRLTNRPFPPRLTKASNQVRGIAAPQYLSFSL